MYWTFFGFPDWKVGSLQKSLAKSCWSIMAIWWIRIQNLVIRIQSFFTPNSDHHICDSLYIGLYTSVLAGYFNFNDCWVGFCFLIFLGDHAGYWYQIFIECWESFQITAWESPVIHQLKGFFLILNEFFSVLYFLLVKIDNLHGW
jgi:hypothetical protein